MIIFIKILYRMIKKNKKVNKVIKLINVKYNG